jgi:hypothetical protein
MVLACGIFSFMSGGDFFSSIETLMAPEYFTFAKEEKKPSAEAGTELDLSMACSKRRREMADGRRGLV